MGKTVSSLGGATVTLFIAAATTAAQVNDVRWYLTALWIASIVAAVAFVIAATIYLAIRAKRYARPLEITTPPRCHYWGPHERQARVVLWVRDEYGVLDRHARYSCVVRIDGHSVVLGDRVDIGGMYMGDRDITFGGGEIPLMLEFQKRDLLIDISAGARADIEIVVEPRKVKGWRLRQRFDDTPVTITPRPDPDTSAGQR